MNCWIARISAAGTLLACGASAVANPPALTPQPRPLPAIPYGYYQTQWRPYPTMISDPEVRIVVPTEKPTVPEPTPTKPMQPPMMDPPPAESPPKKAELPRRPPIQETRPDPRSRIFPPGYIPEATPIYVPPTQPARGSVETRVPRMAPEIRTLNPLPPTGAPVEPQILHLLPARDELRRPDVFRHSAEEASEPRKPATKEKPKAWLELPVAAPMPVVRGSSHSLSEPVNSSPIWQPLPAPR